MTLPWAIYVRVSTEDQALAGVSLDAQLTACRAYCVARGWTVGAEISDPGESASSLRRPGMQQVLAGFREKKFAGVVAWRLDRLTRRMRDLVTLLQIDGVGIVSVTESLDTTTPMGRFVVHLLGAIAQWESETIGHRVKSAMQHMKKQGFWMGSTIPAGCALVKEGPRKRLVRGPQAEEVQMIWSRIVAGASLREVCEHLKAAGIAPAVRPGRPAKTGWTPNTVRNLLISPQVVGVLVDGATHSAARQALAKRSTPIRRGAAANPGAKAMEPSPLAGILRCPACNAAAVQVTATGRGGRYRYFRCTARIKGVCRQKDLRCEPIELAVLEAVSDALVPGGPYHQHLIAERTSAQGQVEVVRSERTRLSSDRDQLSARISQLVLRSQIGSAGWDEAMRVVGAELERVDRRLAELQGLVAAAEVDAGGLDMVVERISRGAAHLAEGSREEQTVILRSLVSSARLVGDEVILDLYEPQKAGSEGSYIDRKKLASMHGVRTIRLRVARRTVGWRSRISSPS